MVVSESPNGKRTAETQKNTTRNTRTKRAVYNRKIPDEGNSPSTKHQSICHNVPLPRVRVQLSLLARERISTTRGNAMSLAF